MPSSATARHHCRWGQSRRTVFKHVLAFRPLEPGLNPARSAIAVKVANLSARFNSQRISATACARVDAIVM